MKKQEETERGEGKTDAGCEFELSKVFVVLIVRMKCFGRVGVFK